MHEVDVDIKGAVDKLKQAGINVNVVMPKIVSRLLMHGERQMKLNAPVDTGYLRGSIYSIQNIKGGNKVTPRESRFNYKVPIYRAQAANEGAVVASAEYAAEANRRSHRPRYFERTHQYMVSILPVETDLAIKQALKGMDK